MTFQWVGQHISLNIKIEQTICVIFLNRANGGLSATPEVNGVVFGKYIGAIGLDDVGRIPNDTTGVSACYASVR